MSVNSIIYADGALEVVQNDPHGLTVGGSSLRNDIESDLDYYENVA